MSYGKMMALNHDREGGGGDRRYSRGGDMTYPQHEGRRVESHNGGAEMAFRDRTGRRHYDNGKFAPERNRMAGGMEEDEDLEMKMGFDMSGRQPEREMGRAAIYRGEDGEWTARARFGEDHGSKSVSKEKAEAWTAKMRNGDGSIGPHWTMEQVKQLQLQKKELQEWELPEVFTAINMLYSKCCAVAKKFNVNNVDFYVCMAQAWLDDPDAGPGKTAQSILSVWRDN